MKGHLITWDVTSFDDPELQWDMVRRDYTVYAADDSMTTGGEGRGDAGSKAFRVVWDAYDSANKRARGKKRR